MIQTITLNKELQVRQLRPAFLWFGRAMFTKSKEKVSNFKDTKEIQKIITEQNQKHRELELDFNQNLRKFMILKETDNIESAISKHNFLNPNQEISKIGAEIEPFSKIMQSEEVDLNLSTLAQLDFPVLIYEIDSINCGILRKFNYLSRGLIFLAIMINLKFYFSYSFLFETTGKALFSAYLINPACFTIYVLSNSLTRHVVLDLSISPISKSVTFTVLKSVLKGPQKISSPISGLKFFEVDSENELISFEKAFTKSYYFRVKGIEYTLLGSGLFHQESLLKKLYNLQ